MTRREAIAAALLTPASLVLFGMRSNPAGAASVVPLCSGTLFFHNAHDGVSLRASYVDSRDRFKRDALLAFNQLFRCTATGEVYPIDVKLFLLLDAIKTSLDIPDKPIVVTSGYRSPAYNEKLCQEGVLHVSPTSFHMQGMAADIAVEGVEMADLETSATQLKAGGVGRYASFIHVDVGPVRYW